MGKGGGGGGTQTVVQNSSPPQFLQDAYTSLLNRATNVANTPLTQYGGPTVAGFTPDQTNAFSEIESAQGAANPYITQAQSAINNSTAAIWPQVTQYSPSQIQNYYNPYVSDVVQSTEAQLQNTDAQQQAQLQGNAISSGAWGGDRAGVASAILSGQQDIANNATIANLENTGFTGAQQEFNTEQQSQLGATEANAWLNSQAGFGLSNLGNEALNTDLTGSSALLQSGALQQQLGQEVLDVPYENFLQQQAYPFQTTDFLQGITEGINAGGSSTGSLTTPGPSTASEVAGLGLTGLGLYNSGLLGSVGEEAAGPMLDGSAGYSTGSGILGFLGGLFNKGGRIRYDQGGSLPTLPEVPNVDQNIVPDTKNNGQHGGTPIPHANIPFKNPQQQQGSDPSSTIKQLGSAMSLAGVNPNDDDGNKAGGRVYYQHGGIASPIHIIPPVGKKLPTIGKPINLGPKPGGAGAMGGVPKSSEMAPWFTRREMGSGRGLAPAQHFDDGGDVAPTGATGGIGGLQPTAQTQNPNTQSFYQRVQQLPVEKLQEAAARMPPNSPQGAMIHRALMQKQMMPNTQQAQQPQQQPGQQPQQAMPSMGFRTGGRTGYDDGGGTYGPGADDIEAQNVPFAPVDQSDLAIPDGNASRGTDPGIYLPAPPPADDLPPAQPSKGVAPPPPQSSQSSGINIPKGQRRTPNSGEALMAAGLAMMSGSSPYALENIGKGGLEGLKFWEQEKGDADKFNYEQGTAEQNAAKLSEEAEWHRNQNNVEQQNADTNKLRAQTDAAKGKWTPYSYTETDPSTGLPVTKTVPFNSVSGEFGTPRDGTISHPPSRGTPSDEELRDRAYTQASKIAEQGGLKPGESIDDRANSIYTTMKQGWQKQQTPTGKQQQQSTPTTQAGPPPQAIEFLKAHPELATQFKAKYGVDPSQYLQQ